MLRSHTVLAAIVLLFNLSPAPLQMIQTASSESISQPGKELLNNGDFRQGVQGWTLGTFRQASARWEVARGGGPAESTPSLRIDVERIGTVVWGVQLQQRSLNVVGGRLYRLSFFARASQPSIKMAVNLQQAQEPHRILTPTTYEFDITDRWREYTLDLRPLASDSNVSLNLIIGYAAASSWFAAVSLQEDPPPAPLGQSAVGNWPDPSRLPAREDSPDALALFDGRRVTTREEWEEQRKPELRSLLQHYMHGIMPPPPSNTTGTTLVSRSVLAGDGIEKVVRISFGPPGTPPISLHLILPSRRREPAPVLVEPSFSRVWDLDIQSVWQSINRGYAVATFWYGDVFPEPTTGSWHQPDFFRGVFPYFTRPGQMKREPHDWGAIAMWAWGVQRVVDYLAADTDIDRRRVAAIGHSRLGHAVLIAAAYDERIALVIPHQSMSQMRTPRGREVVRVKIVNQPHHLSEAFGRFLNQVDRLPFDMHSLVALVAPRPVLITGGTLDEWSDLPGMLEMIRGADPVFRLLGAPGFDGTSVPAPGQLVGSTLALYVGAGGHRMDYASGYREVFWDFAGRYLK